MILDNLNSRDRNALLQTTAPIFTEISVHSGQISREVAEAGKALGDIADEIGKVRRNGEELHLYEQALEQLIAEITVARQPLQNTG